jgi:hypothetical protein
MQEIIKIDLHKVRVVVCTFIQNFRYQNWGTRRGARVPAPGPDESSEGKGRRPQIPMNMKTLGQTGRQQIPGSYANAETILITME